MPAQPVDATTLEAPGASLDTGDAPPRSLALTIAHHSDVQRVGWRHICDDDDELKVARRSPEFSSVRQQQHGALEDPYISRTPLVIRRLADGRVKLDASDHKGVRVDGADLRGVTELDEDALERGVAIELAGRTTLVLHQLDPELAQTELPALGMIGESGALQTTRAQILRIADHNVPVLVRGESGTGKELVARALHQQSGRREAPFVSVNLGAVVANTAAAALFGHARGAFTGAVVANDGYFVAADGGTLFLDEVAEAAPELQVALLRVLESSEVQPVGTSLPRSVDVRMVAATDADLPRNIDEGKFRLPLMMRLGGYELTVAPLRQRRDDIGRLLLHFMMAELDAMGRNDKLAAEQQLWLPTAVVAAAIRHDWPGNVRQLRNFARRLVLDHVDRPTIPTRAAMEWLERQRLGPASTTTSNTAATLATPEPAKPRRALESFQEDELLAALREHDFRPGPAAKALGLSRSSLYELMKRYPSIVSATDLSRAQIESQIDVADGDIAKAAQQLGVSERALRLRMKRLDMS
jgi:two-component system nitrogen regulation response regulator GlnG